MQDHLRDTAVLHHAEAMRNVRRGARGYFATHPRGGPPPFWPVVLLAVGYVVGVRIFREREEREER